MPARVSSITTSFTITRRPPLAQLLNCSRSHAVHCWLNYSSFHDHMPSGTSSITNLRLARRFRLRLSPFPVSFPSFHSLSPASYSDCQLNGLPAYSTFLGITLSKGDRRCKRNPASQHPAIITFAYGN